MAVGEDMPAVFSESRGKPNGASFWSPANLGTKFGATHLQEAGSPAQELILKKVQILRKGKGFREASRSALGGSRLLRMMSLLFA
jgi:hypothetical protein